MAGGGDRRRGAPSCARRDRGAAARLGRALAGGARRRARRGRRRRRAGARRRASHRRPAGGAAGVHVKLDTGMGRLGRATPARPRDADAVAARRRSARGHHDPLRDRRRRRRLLRASSSRASRPGRRSCARAHPEASSTPRTPPPRSRARAHVWTWSAAASPSTASTRSSATPPRSGLEPALELRSYVAEVKPCATGESAGYGRRFVAERDTGSRRSRSATATATGAGSRTTRRSSSAGAGAPLVGHRLDGQHHGRPRRPGAAGTGRADRRPSGTACAPRSCAARSGRSTTRSPAGHCRVPRVHHRDGEPV